MKIHTSPAEVLRGDEIEHFLEPLASLGMLKDAFDSLNANPAPESKAQVGLPKDRRAAFLDVAESLIVDGVNTPEGLALALTEARPDGSLQKYSQALWNFFGTIAPDLTGQHDWQTIYAEKDQTDTFSIGEYQFCEPDYRQILIWAEALELEPLTVVERLHGAQLTNERDQFFETHFCSGRIIHLCWDVELLPLEHFEWVNDLVIESICFTNFEEAENVERSLALPLPELRSFNCMRMGLVSLDLSTVPLLRELECGINRLTELDLSAVPLLTNLHCESNRLTGLELSGVPMLTDLRCDRNQLSELDLSSVPRLTKLDCNTNELANLDLLHVPNLEELCCFGNRLDFLDIRPLEHLEELTSYAGHLARQLGQSLSMFRISPYNNLDECQPGSIQTRLLQRPDQDFGTNDPPLILGDHINHSFEDGRDEDATESTDDDFEKDDENTIPNGWLEDSVSETNDEDNGIEHDGDIDEPGDSHDTLLHAKEQACVGPSTVSPPPNPATFGLTFEVIARLKKAVMENQQPRDDESSNTKTNLYKALFACSIIGGCIFGFVDGFATKTQMRGLIGGLFLGPLVVAITAYGALYIGACVACLVSALCYPFVSISHHFWPPSVLESDIPSSYKNYLGKPPSGVSLELLKKLVLFEKTKTEWEEAQNRLKRSHWLARDGWSFERDVAELLRKRGYEVQVTPGSKDGGIDLIIMHAGVSIIAQCKNHASPVGPAVVRELYGAMISHGASEAWLIASSGVTPGALSFTEGKPLRIIDLNEIIQWEAAAQNAGR